MLDPAFVRQHPDRVRTAIRDKRAGDPALVDAFLARDAERREAQTALQDVQQRLNETSRQIGPLMKAGKREEAAPLLAQSNELKAQKKALEDAARGASEAQQRLMLELPNVPHESVPVGATDEDNVVVAEVGQKPDFSAFGEDFQPLPHWELLDKHGLVDFERGAKVAGAGFPFYIGQGARLQRALVQFFLDQAVAHGYIEMQPPLVINEASGVGTGQIPDKEAMMYEAERDGLFLIPTAEVPVTNFYRDEIFDADALPVKYAAYTPCFRREAGSYGK
ncbi:MAG: aminoacyl--tRNA ligase-related protein, partial [Bacteroidota bacterium]